MKIFGRDLNYIRKKFDKNWSEIFNISRVFKEIFSNYCIFDLFWLKFTFRILKKINNNNNNFDLTPKSSLSRCNIDSDLKYFNELFDLKFLSSDYCTQFSFFQTCIFWKYFLYHKINFCLIFWNNFRELWHFYSVLINKKFIEPRIIQFLFLNFQISKWRF